MSEGRQLLRDLLDKVDPPPVHRPSLFNRRGHRATIVCIYPGEADMQQQMIEAAAEELYTQAAPNQDWGEADEDIRTAMREVAERVLTRAHEARLTAHLEEATR